MSILHTFQTIDDPLWLCLINEYYSEAGNYDLGTLTKYIRTTYHGETKYNVGINKDTGGTGLYSVTIQFESENDYTWFLLQI
jgi:hypothetical protein